MKATWKLAITASVLAGIATAGVFQMVAVKDAKAYSHVPAAQRQLLPGLIIPVMDPVRGEHLFVSKGCVVCHSINGVGGTGAPKLDVTTDAAMMNPFDFFAKMWRGAAPMIAIQQHNVGRQAEFSGQDLADIAAFLHNRQLQKTFDAANNLPAQK